MSCEFSERCCMGSLTELPDDMLRDISDMVGISCSCMLSMTCKRFRRLLAPRGGAVAGEEALASLGYAACRALGMPLSDKATGALAVAGDEGGLLAAARDGFPVGSAVAAAAAARGDIDMLVWAWSMGARLDESVARSASAAPLHVVRWLACQGCLREIGVRGAAAVGDLDLGPARTCKRRRGRRGRPDTRPPHPSPSPPRTPSPLCPPPIE